MAFNTLVFFSLFTAFNARSDERSAFVGMFSNPRFLGAVVLSILLQLAVIYVPALQQAFSTVSLSADDWMKCAAVGESAAPSHLGLDVGIPLRARDRPTHLSPLRSGPESLQQAK